VVGSLVHVHVHVYMVGSLVHAYMVGSLVHAYMVGSLVIQSRREMEGTYWRIAALRRRQVDVHTAHARGVADVYCFLKVLVLVTPPATNVQSIVFGSVISRVMSECTSAFWS